MMAAVTVQRGLAARATCMLFVTMDVGYYLLAAPLRLGSHAWGHRSSVTVIFTLALRLEGIHGVLCRHAVGDSSDSLPGLFIPLRGGMA